MTQPIFNHPNHTIDVENLPYPPPNLAIMPPPETVDDGAPFVLVDGSYYLFRCFYGLPPLTNRDGLPTNAIRGVLNALNKLMAQHKPSHMAVAFDTKAPTFRHKMSVHYKANRQKMPDELAVQIEYVYRLIEYLGIPLIKMDGAEADDVIGTLACMAYQHGKRVLISTGDKDMAQLVNMRVILEDGFKNQQTDVQGVLDKFGVAPKQIIDYLTLMGDSSDGIMGVPKVGEKTAQKLLNEYGTLDNIIADAQNIKGAVGKNIAAATHIFHDKKLATIVTNLPLKLKCDDFLLEKYAPNWQKLYDLYDALQFNKELLQAKAWLNASNTVDQNTKKSAADTKNDTSINIIENEDDLIDALEVLAKKDVIGMYVLPKWADDAHSDALAVAFVCAKAYANVAYYVVLTQQNAPLIDVFLTSKAQKIACYDAKGAWRHLDKVHDFSSVNEVAQIFDVMLASYVHNTAQNHTLFALSDAILSQPLTKSEDIVGKGAKQISFEYVSEEVAAKFACEEATACLALHTHFAKAFAKDANLHHLFLLETHCMRILAKMQALGILIDEVFLQNIAQDFAKKISDFEHQAHDIAGCVFNLASPKQLGAILFEKLALNGGKKTKSGQYSTKESVLSALEHPLADVVLQHRSLAKLNNTYTIALPKLTDKNGRIHTTYHQALTSTGRLSSSDPNLQNIPIRTPEGRLIRKAFVAKKDHVLLAADYSQIELRLMAHFSGDDSLIDAFLQNQDIHTITAAEILDKSIGEVTKNERRSAKAVNFGLLYGMSAFGLAKQLKISHQTAKAYIDRYFARYPKVQAYMQNTRQMAIDEGFVRTILGRKIFAPDAVHKNHAIKEAALRAAINAPLQGSAADIIKLAMIAVDALNLPLLLQVHDELVFEIPKKDAKHQAVLIQEAMQNVLQTIAPNFGFDVDFSVPLLVSVGIGDNWDDAH